MQFADVFAALAIVATLWRQLSRSRSKLLRAVAEPRAVTSRRAKSG